jgi:hypothetical protein
MFWKSFQCLARNLLKGAHSWSGKGRVRHHFFEICVVGTPYSFLSKKNMLYVLYNYFFLPSTQVCD